jgi:hypothetical protein
MDRYALQHCFRDACSRVVSDRQALLRQRQHILELERCGLDAAPARALLRAYEHSQAMNLFDRDRLRQALARETVASVDAERRARSRQRDVMDLHAVDRKAA